MGSVAGVGEEPEGGEGGAVCVCREGRGVGGSGVCVCEGGEGGRGERCVCVGRGGG